MKNILLIYLSFLVLGCSHISNNEVRKTRITEAIQNSDEFIKVYYLAETRSNHIYLVETYEGLVYVIYVSISDPIRVMRSPLLFHIENCKW